MFVDKVTWSLRICRNLPLATDVISPSRTSVLSIVTIVETTLQCPLLSVNCPCSELDVRGERGSYRDPVWFFVLAVFGSVGT